MSYTINKTFLQNQISSQRWFHQV